MNPILKIDNLTICGKRALGWIPIVKGICLGVKRGEVVALIGGSGAGKTTLALSVLGYNRPGTRIVRGRINIDNQDILAMNFEKRRQVRGRQVAYVAQSAAAALNPVLRLGDQIAECLLVHGMDDLDAARKRTVELLQLLNLPEPEKIALRFPHQVSGGQQQRVMVAMAMACRPGFMILDEPTTALDVTTQIEVLKAIKAVIRKNETGAIYVSHDLSVVAQVADRIAVMHGGRIVEERETQSVLNHPREVHTRELIESVSLIPNNSTGFKTGRPKEIGKTALVQAHNIRANYKKGSWLSRISEDQHVLRGVSLSIDPGAVVALVGESGSGKSTLARVLAGLMAPIAGELTFHGTKLHPRVRGRLPDQIRKIQIVFQDPDTTLNPVKRVEEAIGRPLELYFGLKGRKKRDRVKALLNMVELPPDYAFRYPSELSGGEKQRVALARAFGAEPELILCDEVLSALDTVVGATILNLINDLQSRLGVACLFISHDLATVSTIADHVVVLHAGRVCESGSTEDVFLPPYHPYTTRLLSSVPELRSGWLEEVTASQRLTKDAFSAPTPMDNGCAFRTRCDFFIEGRCDRYAPEGKMVSAGHVIYCHHELDQMLAGMHGRSSGDMRRQKV